MTGTEQLAQILFPNTEIGRSISIEKPLRDDTANLTFLTNQPTIVDLNQSTTPEKIDQKQFLIVCLNSDIDVTRSGRNIDNRAGMNPQGSIVTMIPDSNRSNNCNI